MNDLIKTDATQYMTNTTHHQYGAKRNSWIAQSYMIPQRPNIQTRDSAEPFEYSDNVSKESISESGLSNKIREICPKFLHSDIVEVYIDKLSIVVQDILECNWRIEENRGECIFLLDDWRVCCIGTNNTEVDRCLLFDDLDDWNHCLEAGGFKSESFQKLANQNVIKNKLNEYIEEYNKAITEVFSEKPDFEKLKDLMNKNSGNKQSYMESEA